MRIGDMPGQRPQSLGRDAVRGSKRARASNISRASRIVTWLTLAAVIGLKDQGAHPALTARMAGEQDMLALIPEAEFFAAPKAPGEAVRLQWDRQHLHPLTQQDCRTTIREKGQSHEQDEIFAPRR